MLAIEGTWTVVVHQSVAFCIYVVLLMLSLGLTVLKGLKRKAKVGFLLNHFGLFLIVFAAFFGSPDVQKLKMIVPKGGVERIAYTEERRTVMLPFDIALDDFKVEYYEDGVSPRQFTSTLKVDGQKMQTSVNSPCSYKGYTIFQNSYDQMEQRYTVLLLVRNPWLPVVYVGMAMLAIGSVLLLFGKWKAKVVVPATCVLTILFTAFTISKINFSTLMPALRSWWFVPHIFIYMVAYSLMAFGLLMWLYEAWKERKSDAPISTTPTYCLSDALVRSSSALLIIGMLTGSVWAWQAWGDYWAWDAKENWAAVTWFFTLLHLHLNNKRGWAAITIIVLAFLALQITWYGVDYLPSAANSLHTYTR